MSHFDIVSKVKKNWLCSSLDFWKTKIFLYNYVSGVGRKTVTIMSGYKEYLPVDKAETGSRSSGTIK